MDAHNVVPVWCASDKQEVGARTIRSKITAQLPHFWPNIPPPLEPNTKQHSKGGALPSAINWEEVLDSIPDLDRSVKEIDWTAPGASSGMAQLDRFCADFLKVKRFFKTVLRGNEERERQGKNMKERHVSHELSQGFLSEVIWRSLLYCFRCLHNRAFKMSSLSTLNFLHTVTLTNELLSSSRHLVPSLYSIAHV